MPFCSIDKVADMLNQAWFSMAPTLTNVEGNCCLVVFSCVHHLLHQPLDVSAVIYVHSNLHVMNVHSNGWDKYSGQST